MTVDKSKTVTIPVWLISVILTVLTAIVTSWGMVTASKASLETTANRNKEDINTLRIEKASNEKVDIIFKKLDVIEKKLDDLNK